MKEKTKRVLRQIGSCVLLTGFIIFCIGVYYCVVKAGIPYQDPPLELQIEYAVNMGIGEILTESGVWLVICGGIIRLFLWIITSAKRKWRCEDENFRSKTTL